MIEEDGEDEAARAFESLRAEVSLMRRAVERLAAERIDEGHTPDYSETLGVIANNITATAERVDALVRSPALSLTPEGISRQVTAAGGEARREDQRLLIAAQQAMEEVAARLGPQLYAHVGAREQRRRLWWVGSGGLVAGMALWACLAGPVVRTMPASWLLPERMASRILDRPMWEGGQRLMRTAAPEAFAGLAAGNRFVTANRKVLEGCQKRAKRTGKSARCTVKVEPVDRRIRR
jgi:hypothetical protein